MAVPERPKNMAKIFVTRPIPDQGINMLKKKRHQVVVNPTKKIPAKSQIVTAVKGKGYQAILSVLTERIDGQVMDAAGKQLKIVANYAVGFDNIDLEAAKKRGILVTNTPSKEITESVAEHTFTLLMAITRRLVEADKFARAGKYQGWDPFLFLGSDVYGKTIGIVGLGRIGSAVAQRAVKGFGMKALYYDIRKNPQFEKEYQAKLRTIHQILKQADFVSLHVPLLKTTYHLIGGKEFRMMKKTAFLINTSRGPVVDEKALVKALKAKQIAGAAIDVFEFEPKLAPGLAKLDNVILTPHIASASTETRQEMSRVAARNIIAALDGRQPPNLAR